MMIRRLALPFLLTAATAATAQQPAAPVFARIFSDHAVLQRQRPITVWGTATAAQPVTVTLAGRSATARADARGRWRATLPAMPAGGPYTLSAAAGGGTATLTDVKVGDVYLCGGQSNMEFPARLSTNATNGLRDAGDDDLRFVNIAHDEAPAPLDDLKRPAPWQVVSYATVGDASAVCYYMARSLRKTAKVPIGFIHSSWGGTTSQSWTSAPALGGLPRYAEGVDAVALLATDRPAAYAREEKRQEAWWDAHDPAAAAQRAWIAPGFDDRGWVSVTPVAAAGANASEGVAWLRTDVTLTAAQATAANALRLGPIDTYDTAWINGHWVGSGTVPWVWRDYAVPAGVFRAGRNTVVLRILGTHGMTGQTSPRGIATDDGQLIPLPATWRYRRGSSLTGLTGPALPWAVPTSLTTLYNAMIAPLRGYGLTLAAWYQGEANVGEAAEYRTLLPLMIADWRRTFAAPALPFLVVQLTSFGSPATAPGESGWATLRQAQADTVAADPHAGMAVTIDVGDRFDIHPTEKMIVGERLARAARAVAYGEAVAAGGPEATGVTRAGDDLVVAFRRTGGGLRTYGADAAIGFEACAAACRFVTGTVAGDTVVLRGANRPGVGRVRYAWADVPFVDLYGGDDLPAGPFELPVGGGAR